MSSVFQQHVDAIADGDRSVVDAAESIWQDLNDEERVTFLSATHGMSSFIYQMAAKGYGGSTWDAGKLPRLGIPGLRFSDGPRGSLIGPGTAFPVSSMRAASFDVELEEEIRRRGGHKQRNTGVKLIGQGRAIGREMRSQGSNWFGGVCINLARHPGWGRAQESYGEDPVILGSFGAALARGTRENVIPCVKHYALNSMENMRFEVDVTCDDATLRECYLPHFRQVFEDSGCETVMTAYNYVNGKHCSDSTQLIGEIMREEWGQRDALAVTDFLWGIRDTVGSVKAGLDVEMPARMLRDREIRKALKKGEVSMDDIKPLVIRNLACQLAYESRMTKVPAPSAHVLRCAQHRHSAKKAAASGMVVLKNDGPFLPLPDKTTKKVALIGDLHRSKQTGDHGSSDIHDPDVVPPYDAFLADAAANGYEVVYHDGKDIAEAARVAAAADAVILLVGLRSDDEGEYLIAQSDEANRLLPWWLGNTPWGSILNIMIKLVFGTPEQPAGDRATLSLPPHDLGLAKAIGDACGKKAVMCLSGASTLIISPEIRALFSSIMLTFYSGSQFGPALADVVFGRSEPSGRLPFVIPEDASHLPKWDYKAKAVVYDKWWGYRKLREDKHEPAYPFGFGLGYSGDQVQLVGNSLRAASITGRSFEVTVDLKSETKPSGTLSDSAVVVQVYGGKLGDKGGYGNVLLGFIKVQIPHGDTLSVRVPCRIDPLARWNAASRKMELAAGDYTMRASRYEGDPQAVEVTVEASNVIHY